MSEIGTKVTARKMTVQWDELPAVSWWERKFGMSKNRKAEIEREILYSRISGIEETLYRIHQASVKNDPETAKKVEAFIASITGKRCAAKGNGGDALVLCDGCRCTAWTEDFVNSPGVIRCSLGGFATKYFN